MTDKMITNKHHDVMSHAGPPGFWTQVAIVVMSVAILIFSGFMVYTYSGSRTTTAANPPAQTGYTPIVDEVRRVPAPSTVGQGSGEGR
jgi:hypothetical protein